MVGLNKKHWIHLLWIIEVNSHLFLIDIIQKDYNSLRTDTIAIVV